MVLHLRGIDYGIPQCSRILTWFLGLEVWWNTEGSFLIQVKYKEKMVWYKRVLHRYDYVDWVGSARNRNITSTYCRNQSVSLNATKDEYIAGEKKESKDSSSNEEYNQE